MTGDFSDNVTQRLVLGTAQLGMAYGIANIAGQPDIKTAEAIIESAWRGGIRKFDTAQAYGTSEKVLGKVIQKYNLSEKIQITTKLSPEVNPLSQKAVFASVEQSLNHLGLSKIYCLMLHRENTLHGWHDGIRKVMKALIDSQRIETIGVSVYSSDAALQAFKTDGISVIQIPSNVFDRRFEKAGVFSENFSGDKQIYIRSVFLQGLLFLKPDDLPSDMMFAYHTLNQYESLIDEYNISKLELALCYVKQAYPKAKIIIGAETCDQIIDNLLAWKSIVPDILMEQVQEIFMKVDEKILNPSLWFN